MLGIIGLPVPDETLLLLVGYLIHQGTLRPLPAFGAACLGSLCGITLSYALGRTLGLYLVHTYGRHFGVTPERMERVHRWFRWMGRWTLAIGYYVPGVRHLTAYVAGAAELELPVFALFAYGGGIVWCASFIAAGYFLAQRGPQITEGLQRHAVIAAAAGLVLLLVYLRRRGRGEA